MNEKNSQNAEIQNVVAIGSLDQKIDLHAIVSAFPKVDYRPKRFPGLIFRLTQPKTTTLIFRTGKMVCTGAKSEKMAMSAVKKVIRELKKEGFIILRSPKITIENIVATADFRGVVDLEATADILDDVLYEPEMFPGLIYRIEDPKVVVLIFASGKIVITGAKREEQIHEAVEKTREILVDNGLIY